MNNVQFYILLLGAAASIVTVILAWIQSNARISRLEITTDAGFRRIESTMDARFGRVEAMQAAQANDLREFYRILGKLEGRVEEIASDNPLPMTRSR